MRDAEQSVHLIAASVGFIAYGLLWLSIVWGVVLKNGWAFTRVRHATIYGIHQTLVLVGLTLSVVHALAQLAVPEGPVRWIDQVVPFANPTDPIGIGLGVIALQVMLALVLSVLIQRRLSYHRWRRLHLLGYLAYALVTGHVLISGSDTTSILVRLPVVLSLGVVIALGTAAGVARWTSRRSAAAGVPTPSDVVLNVDPSRCVRYGFCAHEAPQLFRLQSDGRLNHRAAISPEHVDDALRAAEACPARAVMLGRRPTAVVMGAGHAPREPAAGGPPVAGGPSQRIGSSPLRPVNGSRVDGER